MKKFLLITLVILLFASCKKKDIDCCSKIPSVTIGSQVWMRKNLDVSTYRNGDPIPHVTDSLIWRTLNTGAWCWYKNDSATYAATYGKLYNWFAVTDTRGLAPACWHIPSDADWNKLIKSIDPAADTSGVLTQSLFAGGALKETGIAHWSSSNIGATNSTGFTGLPGGYRNNGGKFESGSDGGYWWSTTQHNSFNAWAHIITAYDGNSFRGSNPKLFGLSVRCVRD